MLRLFSVTLHGCFCCANEAAHPMKPANKKKIMALFVQYHYEREVYFERTV